MHFRNNLDIAWFSFNLLFLIQIQIELNAMDALTYFDFLEFLTNAIACHEIVIAQRWIEVVTRNVADAGGELKKVTK